jgi:acyl transferase domain-containing protein
VSSIHRDTHFWETALSADAPSWLKDHLVQGTVVLPAAAYVEMALSAACGAYGTGRYDIEDLKLEQPLMLPADSSVTVQVVLTEDRNTSATFRCSSRPAGTSDANWDSARNGCREEV